MVKRTLYKGLKVGKSDAVENSLYFGPNIGKSDAVMKNQSFIPNMDMHNLEILLILLH